MGRAALEAECCSGCPRHPLAADAGLRVPQQAQGGIRPFRGCGKSRLSVKSCPSAAKALLILDYGLKSLRENSTYKLSPAGTAEQISGLVDPAALILLDKRVA